jgi:hypothetical protein
MSLSLHILTGAKGTAGHASKVLNPNMRGVEFITREPWRYAEGLFTLV